MINPEHLQTLRAVVEEGTVLAAADRLGCSPSAVSQQLARLEQEVGQPVMARRGRNLAPIDATTVLVRMAHRISELEEVARADLGRLQQEVTGRVSIATFASAMRSVVTAVVGRLQADYPDLELTVNERVPEEAIAAVRRGDEDVAVVHDWTDRPSRPAEGLQVWPIGLDPVDLILREDDPTPVREGGVALDDLDGRIWVDGPLGIYSDWLLDALEARRLRHRVGARVIDFDARLGLVAQGFGICLLPRLGRAALPPGLVAHPLVEAPTRRVLGVNRRASQGAPSVQVVRETIVQVWRDRTSVGEVSVPPG